MLPLSQTTGYAVRALSCMDDPGGRPVLVEGIADCTGIPRSYLSKLVHKLAKKGLVHARRGHHGGVVLARPAGQITLEDISDAIDGTAWQERCLLGLSDCSDASPCTLHDYWKRTREDILLHLRAVTLAQIERHPDPGVKRCRTENCLACVP